MSQDLKDRVDALSVKILQDAHKEADGDTVVATGAMLLAAARACGWAQHPLPLVLAFFTKHFLFCEGNGDHTVVPTPMSAEDLKALVN